MNNRGIFIATMIMLTLIFAYLIYLDLKLRRLTR